MSGGIMGYQFSAELKPSYLYCRVQGKNTIENVLGYLGDVRASCEKERCTSVLIEENLHGPGLKVQEIHRIVSEGTTVAWPDVLRIAYVDANPEHSFTNLHFAEVIARSRGIDVRMFANVNEAEEWLRKAAATLGK
jgi:hypothetical protein